MFVITRNDIKIATPQGAQPVARVDKLGSSIDSGAARIVELGGVVAQGMFDLEGAIAGRMKEASKLVVSAKELVDAVDTLKRAWARLRGEWSRAQLRLHNS